MRICFLVQYAHVAGTYFRWHNLARALQEAGHTVHVYAGDFDVNAQQRTEIREGVEYFIYPSLFTTKIFYNPSDPFTGLMRWWNMRHAQYDVFHLFQPFVQAYVPWKLLQKKNPNAVFVYDWDDLWTEGLFGQASDIRTKWVHNTVAWLEKKLPHQADGTTVCSGFLQKRFPTQLNSKVLYNGFWPKKNWPNKEELRTKWNMEKQVMHLSYIGKTAGELSWIAKGFHAAQQAGLSVQLWIAGPEKAVVQEAGLWEQPGVHYVGMLSVEEAAGLAGASDLGLIPLENNAFNQSRFPIKFFDYLSVATPVYYSAVGELVEAGKNQAGAFAGPAEEDAWVAQLPELISQIQTHPPNISLTDLEAAYAWPAVADQLIQFYKTIDEA